MATRKSEASKAAAALGRLARGIPKTLTPEESEKRRQAMHAINARRRLKSALKLKAKS